MKRTAFAINSGIKGRVHGYTTNAKKILSEKTIRELAKGNLSGEAADLALRILKTFVLDQMSLHVLGKLRGDNARVPLDMLGGDKSGYANLLSMYKAIKEIIPSSGAESIRIKKHEYQTYLNPKPIGRFRRVPFNHSTKTVTLFDTKRDCLSIEDKLSLITESGFNQSIIDIFDKDSFITLEDLWYLTHASHQIEKATNKAKVRKNKALNHIIDENREENKTNVKKLKAKLAKQQLDSLGTSRLYSLVQKIKTTLYINSDMPAYITNIKVSLCTHALFRTCDERKGALSTYDLYTKIINEIDNPEERSIIKKNLLGRERSNIAKSKHFKKTLFVLPGTRINSSKTFQDNVRVLRSYKFQLRPTEVAVIELIHNFERGIDLFDLKGCEINEACAHTFFIIEATGSGNARLTLNNGMDQIKENGCAPIKLRYEMNRKITFISNDNEYEDYPISILDKPINSNFEDGTLAEFFYPSRDEKFNVNLQDLDIGGKNPTAKWRLDMDSSTLLTPTLLERVVKLTNNNNIELDEAAEFEKNLNRTAKEYIEDLENRTEDNTNDPYTTRLKKHLENYADNLTQEDLMKLFNSSDGFKQEFMDFLKDMGENNDDGQ